ncbi:MAG: zinc ribbon domain-containing protein [Lentisphaerae bacterium]|nr:zinc ribbon domain-containing protein [Lentisphaerota bacterium]
MPTYEYECDACGKTFDFFQKMTDEPLKTCICCKKKPVRRMIGAGAGIIFKGSGFYCTDYRKEGYKTAQKADSAKSSESTAKSEGSAKPESIAKPEKGAKSEGSVRPAATTKSNTSNSEK